MPVPSNGDPGISELLVECLEKADTEFQKTQESLQLLGQELQAVRDAAGGAKHKGCYTNYSALEDPPALLLHQQQMFQRKPIEPRFRRASGSTGQEVQLRLHGRWMELSTQAGAEVMIVKDKGANSLNRLRQSFSNTMEELEKQEESKWCKVWHPQGYFKLCWDIVALLLLMNDAVILPPALAWDITMDEMTNEGFWVRTSFFVSIVFWTCDLLVNLNTAVYVKGLLVSMRPQILRYYASNWLGFDVLIISLDYTFVFLTHMQSEAQLLRFARILRVMRLIRILKLSKMNTLIEESAAAAGRQWVTLVVAISKTAVGMIMVAHFLTCFWYWVAVELVNTEQVANWIQVVGADTTTGPVQYLHALRWIMNAPSPPDIDPRSGIERGVDIGISATTLVVIGSAISKISGTMAELRAMNEESARRRREVRLYLASQAVSYELVTRIMRFVDYKLEKVSANNMDATLISPTLQLELYVNQRADFLSSMPIFSLAQECYPEIFGAICAAFQKHFFEKGEAVFNAGSYATALHITYNGQFEIQEENWPEPSELHGIHWFGELSLYCDPVWHSSTLTPTSFAETFNLSGAELVECIKSSRGCTTMFCEYAKDFLAAMQKTTTKFGDEDQILQGEKCCRSNQHFQAVYPDPSTLLSNIIVVGKFETVLEIQDEPVKGDSKAKLRNSKSSDSIVTRLSDTSQTSSSLKKKEVIEDPGLGGFVKQWLSESQEEDLAANLPTELQRMIPELDKLNGTHVVLGQAAERDRGESSCISILALVRNRYDIFTKPQAEHVKLLESQWLELQQIISWIEPEPEELQAVLVLLAIRGLGKSKVMTQQLAPDLRRPERAVIHVSQNRKNVVPSVRWLNDRGTLLFEEALMTHELFNLAQMLQGENCPANVKELRLHIEEKGDAIFRFYILFLLGFMSGLAAGEGSRFMNAKNADATIGGIRVLQKLMKVNATAIYWGYLGLRAQKLSLPFNSPEDLVLVRLACLARVQDQKDYESLRLAWKALGDREQISLTDHFLADGIEEQAFVFEFLPNCVGNAKANPLIGLTCLLDVLTDLLACLRIKVATLPQAPKLRVLPVDLSDMGEFIAAVRNRFVFVTCTSRCELKFHQGRVRVEMTGGNWGRATDSDSDLTSIAYTLQDLVQKQQKMEERFMSKPKVEI